MFRLLEKLKEDNHRLAYRCAALDHVIRLIAEAAGFEGTYTGVDVDPECLELVEHVRKLRETVEKITNEYPGLASWAGGES